MKAVLAICRQHNKKLIRSNGFSLVELMLVVLLIFIIVSLVSTVLISSENTSRDIVNIVRSEIDARLALYRISKDIRETHEIISAGGDDVSFVSNIDSDEYYEEVHYYAVTEGNHYNLYRQIDGGTGRLYIENIVDNNIFIYYSGLSTPEGGMNTSTPITDEDLLKTIKYIDININIDQSGLPSVRTMVLNTMITLRNRIY